MEVLWFYKNTSQTVGPLTASQLREHANAKQIVATDHVRRNNDTTWVLAAKVKGLFDSVSIKKPADIASPSMTTDASEKRIDNRSQNLIDCPDCNKSISKRATQCPHCGCPMGEQWLQGAAIPQYIPQPISQMPKVSVFDNVFRCVVQAVRDAGYAVEKIDKVNGMVSFKTGATLFSFGTDISLVVIDMGETCSIDMNSTTKGQITDWGESKRIGRKIASATETLLAAEGMHDALQ